MKPRVRVIVPVTAGSKVLKVISACFWLIVLIAALVLFAVYI